MCDETISPYEPNLPGGASISEFSQERYRLWVDNTGSYGDADSIRIVDVPANLIELWDFGQASDSEIAEYGLKHGKAV